MKKIILPLLLAMFVLFGGLPQAEAAAPVTLLDTTARSEDNSFAVGFVTAYDDTIITVNGITFLLEGAFQIEEGIEIGDLVIVAGQLQGDDLYVLFAGKLADVGGELSLVGNVEAISADSITIVGLEMIIDADTQIEGDPQVDDIVQVEALVGDGVITALSISLQTEYGNFEDFALVGIVEALSDTSITVDGTTFAINAQTDIIGEVAVGDDVYILATENEDGSYTALMIQAVGNQFFTTGTIDAFDSDSLTVDGEVYALADDTVIMGELAVGANVFIVGDESSDGTRTVTYVEVMPDIPLPPVNTQISAYGEVTAASDMSITVDGVEFVISAETEIFGEPTVGSTAYISGTTQADGTNVADYIEVLPEFMPIVLLAGEISDLTDTSMTLDDQVVQLTEDTVVDGTLADGAFALVIASNEDDIVTAIEVYVIDFSIEGVVEAVSATSITVDGQQFQIDQQTEMEGSIELGNTVAVAYSDGAGRASDAPTARYITSATSAPTAVALSNAASTGPSLLPLLLVLAAFMAVGTIRSVNRK